MRPRVLIDRLADGVTASGPPPSRRIGPAYTSFVAWATSALNVA